MPLFLDIPIEILQMIMDYLLPDDVDNFSESREEIRTISTRLLSWHIQLKDDYSEVLCGWFGVEEAVPPLFVLRDIHRLRNHLVR